MITILLFAQLQETAGTGQLTIEAEDTTIEKIKEMVQHQYPAISLQHVMTALNEEFVTDTELVETGDIVAFIPPVSGG